MTRNEKRLKAAEEAMAEKSGEIQEIWKKADDENRGTTDEERQEVETLLKAVDELKLEKHEAEAAITVEAEVRSIADGMGPSTSVVVQEAPKLPERAKSLGEQVVTSDGYKRMAEKGFAGRLSTGQIELQTKATLLEGDNTFLAGGTPGDGAALVPLDQRPGVMPILFQRLTLMDLLASGTTASNAINYVVETVADSGADVVAEGGAKPESTLEFSNEQVAVKKIATLLQVSDEMLSDAQALASYINARLTLFVQNEEEMQLLHGAGGGNFLGLEPQIPAANRMVVSGATSPNNADHIFEAITVARASYLEPDGIIMHPDDWADLRLLKDSTQNYIGGSPFSNTGSNPAESLWGKRVVVTYNCIPGKAVVGAFGTGAQRFTKGGLTVEATNSHSDNFSHDITAIRAEVREALAVYRPEAFAIADVGAAS